MKVLYKNARILALLLSFIFLLQESHVYHKIPISLDEAVTANKRMKVITTDDKKYKFRKIEKIGSIYYGTIKIDGEITKIPLQQNEIKSVRQVDKTTSTILTVGTVLVSVGVIVIVIGLITFDYEMGPNDL